MSSTAPRSEQLADPQLARMQRGLEDATAQARSCLLVDGKLISSVAMVAGTPVDVPHGLGRAFKGVIVAGVSSASIVFVTSAQRDTAKFVSLDCSASTTATVWVF